MEKSSRFSLSHLYCLAQGLLSAPFLWSLIWRSRVLTRVSFFCLGSIVNRNLTVDQLNSTKSLLSES